MIRAGAIGLLIALLLAAAGTAQFYLGVGQSPSSPLIVRLSEILMGMSWAAGFLLAMASAFLIILAHEVRKW